jgi:hypothetical protein
MEKLELKHIQSYPMGEDGVKILLPKHQFKYGEQVSLPLNGVSVGTENELQLEMLLPDGDLCFTYEIEIKKCKLVLHDLSDLTKEIEVNGEKFVPLVELAKIIHKNTKLVAYSVMDNLGYYGVLCDWGINFETNLIYYQEIKSWYVNVNGKVCTQYDTLYLFEKLFEWHFNVYNLPEHLWIDKNTLK